MKLEHCVLGCVMALATAAAAAQQPQQSISVAQAGDSRCRKEVRDYVETMKFVRQTAGAKMSERVAFVSEPELDMVVASQGHCAAAQLLRQKGTPR